MLVLGRKPGEYLMIGDVMVHTALRYREIRRLSEYLAAVRNGGRSLDIRDNREGELSIDIVK